MFGMTYVMGLMSLLLLATAAWANALATQAEVTRITMQAGHMAVYSGLIKAYATAHPTVTGTVADTDAGFPAWFHRTAGEQNYVQGGRAYVFLTPETYADGMWMARGVGGSAAGVKNPSTSTLVIPGSSVPGESLPAVIPNGAFVIVR